MARHFQGACWQRCQYHFTGNLLSLAPKGRRKDLHQELRAIFGAPDLDVARRFLSETIAKWENIRPEVAERLEEAQDDVLACFHFPASHRRRIRTTNCVERLNQEIRRRTRVVRIFRGPKTRPPAHHRPVRGAVGGMGDREKVSGHEPFGGGAGGKAGAKKDGLFGVAS